jgi:hypothetical protein
VLEWLQNLNAASSALLAAISTIVVGLVVVAAKTRDVWGRSSTSAKLQEAEQAGVARYMKMLEVSGTREVSAIIEADRLRVVNSNLVEELATITEREKGLHRELTELQAANVRASIEFEGQQKVLRERLKKVVRQRAQLAIELQKKGGDLTVSKILDDE